MDETYSNKSESNQAHLSLEDARKVFGQNLRKIREALGQSQKDLIHLTRISPPFIEALEKGDFDVLPGEVFGRGFVKNICKALDVENDALLAEFNQCWGKAAPKTKLSPGPSRSFGSLANKDRLSSIFNIRRYFSGRVILTYAGIPMLGMMMVFFVVSRITKRSAMVDNVSVVDTEPAPAMVPPPVEDVLPSSAGAEVVLPTEDSAVASGVVKSTPELKEQTIVVEAHPSGEIAAATATATPAVGETLAQEKSHDPIGDLGGNKVPAISEQAKQQGSEQVIKLEVLEAVQVTFKKDKGEVQKHSLTPGTHTFEFSHRGELWVEDPSKVEILFNNKSLGRKVNDHAATRMTFYGKGEKDRALF